MASLLRGGPGTHYSLKKASQFQLLRFSTPMNRAVCPTGHEASLLERVTDSSGYLERGNIFRPGNDDGDLDGESRDGEIPCIQSRMLKCAVVADRRISFETCEANSIRRRSECPRAKPGGCIIPTSSWMLTSSERGVNPPVCEGTSVGGGTLAPDGVDLGDRSLNCVVANWLFHAVRCGGKCHEW